MPRIRTIKPEFASDELMAKLPPETRLLFVLMWTQADDEGRLRANPAQLSGQFFPFDSLLDTGRLTEMLRLLVEQERIWLYSVSGQIYAEIVNWLKHQNINRPSRSVLPGHSDGVPVFPEIHGGLTEDSMRTHGGLTEGSLTEKEKEGKRKGREGNGNARGGIVEPELMPFSEEPSTAFFSNNPDFDHLFNSWPEGRKGLPSNVARLYEEAATKVDRDLLHSMAQLWIDYWSSDDRAPYAMSFERWLLNERWRERPPKIPKSKGEREVDDIFHEIKAFREQEGL